MKKFQELLEKRWFAYMLATCSAVLLYVILTNLPGIFEAIGSFLGVFSSIVLGLVFAYLLAPIVGYFERRVFRKVKKEKTRHTLAVALSVVLILAIFILLLVVLIPSLTDSVAGLVSNAGNYANRVQIYLNDFSAFAAKLNLDVTEITGSLSTALSGIINAIPDQIGSIVNASFNIGKSVANTVIAFILAIYFLSDKDRLIAGVEKLRHAMFPEAEYEQSNAFWLRCHSILIRFIGFDLLDALIVGLINAVLMAVFRMPYIPLISVIVGLTNLLPTFGPIVGALIGGVILVLSAPKQALIFLIFTVIIQTVDGYILKPKMFGGSLGVPAVWVLITIIIGGKLFGVVGILLAIPFAAIFTFLYEEMILPWLRERRKKRAATQKQETDKKVGGAV